jgi:carboxymethylenebutenolidase
MTYVVNNAETWAEHMRSEIETLDVEQTLQTMTPEPCVNHVPTMTGGFGAAGVRQFYREHFIGQWPSDTTIMPISRTTGDDQIVDEMLIAFTHDRVLDCIPPGVALTGRRIELPAVAIVRFEKGKVAREHIYWDQGSVLVQAGLIDPEGLPLAGAEVAAKLKDPTLPSNTLITERTQASWYNERSRVVAGMHQPGQSRSV